MKLAQATTVASVLPGVRQPQPVISDVQGRLGPTPHHTASPRQSTSESVTGRVPASTCVKHGPILQLMGVCYTEKAE